MTVDPKLREFGSPTPRQIECLDAIDLHGSERAAAKAMGVTRNTVADVIKVLRRKAARAGYAPGHWRGGTAPGYLLGKVTVHRNYRTGEAVQGWERHSPDHQAQLELMRQAVEAMSESIKLTPARTVPALCDAALANVYTVTDYHFGMAAKKVDGSSTDWDLTIAENTLVALFENLIARSPPARVGILNQLGDLLHFDGLLAITPTSGNVLDASSSYNQMVAIVIRALRRVIAMLLSKHEAVHIIMAEGNHDLASSVWLRQMFAVLYEKEPRITVDTNPLPYYAYRHGKVFLGFSHGHKRKKEGLPLLFAAMYREMFGQTKAGFIHCGHEHHVDEKEYPGFKVIQHPTMTAPDSHALRGGWMSEREASAITYHEDGYQVGRTTCTPEMLSAA